MRIRKRQIPLPFSSLSPVPLSDPLLNQTPVVQLQHSTQISPQKAPNLSHGGHTLSHLQSPPFDQVNQLLLPAAGGSNGWDSADDANNNNGSVKKSLQVEDDGDEEEGTKRNDTRGRNVFSAETSNGVFPDYSSSSQVVVERWCEREKAFPLKKRRGIMNEEACRTVNVSEKKIMKTKMNNEESRVGKKRSRARGGALMEGSRCSRVNGRGWRCCQQTLVGYSLCEHHLGKGRLRSMSRNFPAKKDEAQEKDEKKREEEEEEDEKKPLALVKKRMKLGVVKARSISSLLGQTDAVTVSDQRNQFL